MLSFARSAGRTSLPHVWKLCPDVCYGSSQHKKIKLLSKFSCLPLHKVRRSGNFIFNSDIQCSQTLSQCKAKTLPLMLFNDNILCADPVLPYCRCPFHCPFTGWPSPSWWSYLIHQRRVKGLSIGADHPSINGGCLEPFGLYAHTHSLRATSQPAAWLVSRLKNHYKLLHDWRTGAEVDVTLTHFWGRGGEEKAREGKKETKEDGRGNKYTGGSDKKYHITSSPVPASEQDRLMRKIWRFGSDLNWENMTNLSHPMNQLWLIKSSIWLHAAPRINQHLTVFSGSTYL